MPDLITATQAAAWLNISPTQAAADAAIPGLISAMSQYFLTLIGRQNILAASYTERRNGTGTRILGLINTPIISVSSVVVNNVTVPASPDGVQPGYVADENTIQLVGGYSGINWFPSSPGSGTGYPAIFFHGVGNVFVTYTAGYAAVPLDIQQCVADMVGWAYKNRDRIGVSSQRFADNLSNSYSQAAYSLMALACIKKYRKTAVQW